MRILLAYTLLATAAVVFADDPSTLVDLGYAKYQGTLNNATGNVNFQGIRYAAAPTGTGRWKEPQPPATTSGVQLADKLPNTCISAPGLGVNTVSPFLPPRSSHTRRRLPGTPPHSEDCLYLNIATPKVGPGNLPVVVWIHGGGYVEYSAWYFNAEDLVRGSNDQVVSVVIQYRLGVYGFLSGQKVHDGGVLNAGLLDQQFALQWVQQHISKFGGDPAKVTIWGESSGAGSVVQHLIANGGNTQPKLFRAGMLNSHYLPPQYPYNHRIPEQVFTSVVEQTGCSSAPDALACLRQADVGLLNRANNNITAEGFWGLLTLTPVIDGKFITDRPSVLLGQGKINADTILTVDNTHESALADLVDPSTADTVKIPEYLANLWPELTKTQIDEAVALYADLGKPIDQAIAINSDSVFLCPSFPVLRALKGKGFKGQLAVPPAYHLDDLVYLFPTSFIGIESSPPFNNTEFKNNFVQSYLKFVVSLDPNVKWNTSNTLPHWPQWTENGHAEMVFNKTEANQPSFQVVPTEKGLIHRCAYWDKVSTNTWQ
ncbi:hypothetical protein D9756_009943 [Leucocoprinus leucothites]|uniref:Carboxylic ester hydrolase n=1 Tax=Leucocoprinus leucothites TaxID=201217 RepID=A0A8H5CTV2_9AGAR|nr:hypothetical protein D9756_009943 [Leucoagaricus leucothites]